MEGAWLVVQLWDLERTFLRVPTGLGEILELVPTTI